MEGTPNKKVAKLIKKKDLIKYFSKHLNKKKVKNKKIQISRQLTQMQWHKKE